MKILILAPDDYYDEQRHGVSIRELNVSQELARMGHEVSLTGRSPTPMINNLVRVVSWSDFRVKDYDGIVILPEHTHRAVAKDTGQMPDLRAHGNVIGWFDSCLDLDDDMSYCRVIGTSTVQYMALYTERYPRSESIPLPWAITEEALHVSPWPDDRPRVVYVGNATQREIDMLNALASALSTEAEMWIATGQYMPDGLYRGVTREERQRLFHPAIRFCADLCAPDIHHAPYEGPILFSDALSFYAGATVGLCLGRDESLSLGSVFISKPYGCLGMGLPMVVESSVVNANDIVGCDAGRMVPWGKPEYLIAATREMLAHKWDRQRIIDTARRRIGTWADRAKTIEANLIAGAR